MLVIDCSQPLYERARKKSRASAKHAGGGGWGLRAKRARRNREAVDIFGKKSAY